MLTNAEHDASEACRRLHELLLAHLRAVDAPFWPGADGLTLEEVLLSYPQAAADGLVPDLPALREQHPDLAEVLAAVDCYAQGTSPVCTPWRPASHQGIVLPSLTTIGLSSLAVFSRDRAL
jgi:hypothetical protein